MFDLSREEMRILKRLSTPEKIQDFLDALPINFEKGGETHMSPRRVLREQKAHCIEGALLAAAAFLVHGKQPLLLDLKTHTHTDDEHVLAPFCEHGYWGAISKTNHAVSRYRDPIYKTIRELALSYYHEYISDDTGKKMLASYSRPFNLKKLGNGWITTEADLWELDDVLNSLPHFPFVPREHLRRIRRASSFEQRVLSSREWNEKDPRT